MTSAADAIRSHIERHIGPIHQVFNDWQQSDTPISVQHVLPTETRPVHTLVTVGMSGSRIAPPGESPDHLELMMSLWEGWKLDAESMQRAEWNWPVRTLQELARRSKETHIRWGDLIANGEPPKPYAPATKLCAVLVVPSLLVPTAFYELETDAKRIGFYAAVPIYKEEWQLGLKHGAKALMERIVDRDVNDVIDLKRKNVARPRLWNWLRL
jgi:hypothetical protein